MLARFLPALQAPVLIALLAGWASGGNIWFVDASAPCPGSGTTSAPYCSLQYAIDQPTTLDGDLILVAPGSYIEPLVIAGKSLILVAKGPPGSVVLHANFVAGSGTDLVLRILGPQTRVALSGFTLECGTGFYTTSSNFGQGGGLYCRNASVIVRKCTFRPRKIPTFVQDGAGIYAEDCSLEVSDSIFAELIQYGRGGGVACLRTTALIEGCVFDHTHLSTALASRGGGIYCEGGAVHVSRTLFTRCGAQDGGAVFGPATVEHCVFTSNLGRTGGAATGGARLVSCEFTGNHANEAGGAVAFCTVVDSSFTNNRAGEYPIPSAGGGGAYRSVLDSCIVRDNWTYWCGGGLRECLATRCLLSGNQADRDGGAVFASRLDRCTIHGNTVTRPHGPPVGGALACAVSNSIVWGNDGASCDATTVATWSDIEGGWPGMGNIDADPMFWDASSGDLHLTAGSPCIDSGDPLAPRDPDGSRADMGALPYDAGGCGAPVHYCTGKTSSQGCVARIDNVGVCQLGHDGFHLTASDVVGDTYGFLLLGQAAAATPFAGGTLCLASLERTPQQLSGGTPGQVDCSGAFDYHLDASTMSTLGLQVGTTLYAQYVYLDPKHPDGTGLGLSDALRFRVCP